MKELDITEYIEKTKDLEIRVGCVKRAERIEKSKKLLKLSVDFGNETRTIVTNLGDKHEPEDFNEEYFVFVTNLKPAVIMGVESHGMIVPLIDESGALDFKGNIGSYIFKPHQS